ncbi:MAG: hypothetical protein KME45_03180 [Stenomitos rutilans HA7619-LM2]|jgi:hypothetical protein|nr:hypothetical protein [Stenomitos rutilans HA7619-LM2]MBW4469388.1 hypothetical protein [Stenomitos rutilans HA7619-LM2]
MSIEDLKYNDFWKHKCLTVGCSFETFDRHQSIALKLAQTQLAYSNTQVVKAGAETIYQWFAKGKTKLPQTEQEALEWAKDLLLNLSGDLLIGAAMIQASAPGWFDEAKKVWVGDRP